MADPAVSDIALSLGGLGVVGLAVRAALTWLNKQGTISQGDSAQKEIYERLAAEAKKWAVMHSDMAKQYEASMELIAQLRVQNAMMRMLLVQSGINLELLDEMQENFKLTSKDK